MRENTRHVPETVERFLDSTLDSVDQAEELASGLAGRAGEADDAFRVQGTKPGTKGRGLLSLCAGIEDEACLHPASRYTHGCGTNGHGQNAGDLFDFGHLLRGESEVHAFGGEPGLAGHAQFGVQHLD